MMSCHFWEASGGAETYSDCILRQGSPTPDPFLLSRTHLIRLLPTVGHLLDGHHLIIPDIPGLEDQTRGGEDTQ